MKRKRRDDKDGMKAYEDVITDEAKTDSGLFVVHRIDDKLYYEIPQDKLGGEMLLGQPNGSNSQQHWLRRHEGQHAGTEMGAERR